MTIPRRRRPIALLLLLAVCANAHAGSPNAGSAHAVSANGNPDAGLYGSFDFDDAFDTAYLSVCGSVPGSDGCYGSATLSGFGRIGAMMESSAVVTANLGTVSREIFVVDQAVGGGTSTAMSLSVYRLTIVVNAPEAACTLVLLKTIPLPNTGGLNAHTYMAANAHYLFIGTDQDPYAVRVNAVSYVVSKAPGPTPPTKVSSITADDYGYVDVTFGSLGGSGAVRAYDSAGTDLGLTSGEAFKLGSGQGLSTTDVLATQVADVPAIVRYHPSANDVAATNPNPDAGLSIDYGFDPTFRTVTWKLCGSVPGSSGCYGNGTIGTFGHIGAMVQGLVSIDKTNDIVRRDLYIFDQAVGGGSSTTVGLYVYRMTETIAAPNPDATRESTVSARALPQPVVPRSAALLVALGAGLHGDSDGLARTIGRREARNRTVFSGKSAVVRRRNEMHSRCQGSRIHRRVCARWRIVMHIAAQHILTPERQPQAELVGDRPG